MKWYDYGGFVQFVHQTYLFTTIVLVGMLNIAKHSITILNVTLSRCLGRAGTSWGGTKCL